MNEFVSYTAEGLEDFQVRVEADTVWLTQAQMVELFQRDKGIKRVTSLFEKYGCPKPVFENFQHGFKVTAYPVQGKKAKKAAKSSSKLGENSAENDTERLTKYQKLIIDSMRNNASITSRELALIVGIGAVNIRVNILKLKKRGLIERIGSDRSGYWKINKPNKDTKMKNRPNVTG
ncbi:MAG: hypothetical protein LBK47_03790 [Prevotellaceae bacterium]|jgi:ATP-dependent DNA helicase RecG|nr:hypothetical protein [Prevotellaceae bacterium]